MTAVMFPAPMGLCAKDRRNNNKHVSSQKHDGTDIDFEQVLKPMSTEALAGIDLQPRKL